MHRLWFLLLLYVLANHMSYVLYIYYLCIWQLQSPSCYQKKIKKYDELQNNIVPKKFKSNLISGLFCPCYNHTKTNTTIQRCVCQAYWWSKSHNQFKLKFRAAFYQIMESFMATVLEMKMFFESLTKASESRTGALTRQSFFESDDICCNAQIKVWNSISAKYSGLGQMQELV